MNHPTPTRSDDADDLRSAVNDITDQLCMLVNGRDIPGITTECRDRSIQELTVLLNFLFDKPQQFTPPSSRDEPESQKPSQPVGEALITIDETGIVQTINHAAAFMFGYEQDEVLEQHFSQLVSIPEGADRDEDLLTYLRAGHDVALGARREVEAKRKDDTCFSVQLTVSEIDIADTRLFAISIVDLTCQVESLIATLASVAAPK